MLRQLRANKSEFSPINFQSGLNVILAEEAEDSTPTDSRNARGKTTLLLVLNFMLGGNLASQLQPLRGNDWIFVLTLELVGGEVTVSRAVDSPSTLAISYTPEAKGVVENFVEEGTISLDAWKQLMGLALFRLDQDEQVEKRGISVRTLLSYVVRTDAPKDPFKILPQQAAWSSRQHIAFMFGLDWQSVHRLHDINRSIEALDAVQTANSEGLLSSFGNETELLLARSEAQRRLEASRARLESFTVLDDPAGTVSQADRITGEITALRDDALIDERMRTLYESALTEARNAPEDPLSTDVAAIYEEAGTLLGEAVRRRLEEVQAFHNQLAQNRFRFLSNAISEIDERSSARNSELERLAAQRSQLVRALSAGGALEELLALQDQTSQLERAFAEADYKLQQVRELVANGERLRVDRAIERRTAQDELSTNRAQVDRIAARFDDRIQQLYGVSGVLNVTVDNSGYNFAIKVAGESSTGVNRMKLFCLDLALLEEGLQSDHHPNFLVHDSVVFDGVDPRQIASALSLAHSAVEELSGQYVCTLNSNDVHDDLRSADWFQAAVIRTILDTEAGGALGVIF